MKGERFYRFYAMDGDAETDSNIEITSLCPGFRQSLPDDGVLQALVYCDQRSSLVGYAVRAIEHLRYALHGLNLKCYSSHASVWECIREYQINALRLRSGAFLLNGSSDHQ